MRSMMAFAALLLTMTACTQVPQWTLFYYPDAAQGASAEALASQGELDQHISGYYQQLEQCLAKGAGMVKLSQTGSGSYLCGELCQRNEAGELKCQRLETLASQ
ncbi:hypothetical protein [Shewanella spartinae]|uniref:hypothetical protein n=1 Tax=Shewanella spartinae TaxID=2864205 RepID=UPI001C65EC21|nr:hypothetical protein [Shewanella spartinae]QYJ94074.1 hypothetical protein K0I31_01350 [Shewanella spartinae]